MYKKGYCYAELLLVILCLFFYKVLIINAMDEQTLQSDTLTAIQHLSRQQSFAIPFHFSDESTFFDKEIWPSQQQPHLVAQKSLQKQKTPTTRKKYTRNLPHTLYRYTCPQCNKNFKGKDKWTLKSNMKNSHSKQHPGQKFDEQHFEANAQSPTHYLLFSIDCPKKSCKYSTKEYQKCKNAEVNLIGHIIQKHENYSKQSIQNYIKRNCKQRSVPYSSNSLISSIPTTGATASSQTSSSSNFVIKKSNQKTNQSNMFHTSFSPQTEFDDQNFIHSYPLTVQTNFEVQTSTKNLPMIIFAVDCPLCNVNPPFILTSYDINDFNAKFSIHMITHDIMIFDTEKYIKENFIPFSVFCTKCNKGVYDITKIEKFYTHECL